MLEQAMSKFAGNALIRDKFDNYIGGKWVAPVRGAYFDNISPVTGQVVCQIARGTAEDIELALDAAHAATSARRPRRPVRAAPRPAASAAAPCRQR